MATSADYLAFVLEQFPPLWDVRSRKMFGEYMVYLTVLDDLMRDAPCGCPYDGAKEHYILDVENRELTEQVLQLAEAATPLSKP